FSRYLHQIKQYPRLDRGAELRLARRYKRNHDSHAADLLVQSHLRDVVAIASQYRGYGFRLSDLVEEGNIGLLEAVRRFDPSRNLRFMTYAAYWVRAYILAHVLKQFSMVGVGTGPLQSKLFFRLARERARLSTQLGENESSIVTSLAKQFGTSEARVLDMAQRLEKRDASLDAQVYMDGDATLLDTLRDDGQDQEEDALRSQRNAAVRTAVERIWTELDERERAIIVQRLLADGDEATLADLGKRFGLSRERVRQLESRVKMKLRRALQPIALAA
ncbi:MAG TPA: RNA polymerase factor sigma-32, partial [Solirubrobacteraceae bacterium]|nr:RNA polymerase factor sigma-32 [Solirubrobacteraceae bacterium]